MPVTRIELSDEHRPIVDAAIAFGDGLARLPFVTDEQRGAIAHVQGALRQVPDVARCVRGEYEIEVTTPQFRAALDGQGWGPWPTPTYLLSFWVDFASDADGLRYVDVGGLHHTPERHEGDEFDGDQHETKFELYPSHGLGGPYVEAPAWKLSGNGGYVWEGSPRPWWQEWAWGTEDPSLYVAPGVHVEVSAQAGPRLWVSSSDGRRRDYDWSEKEWWRGDECYGR